MRNLKQILLASIFVMFWLSLLAQSLSPQSVNSVGATMTHNTGSLYFTVGELVIDTQTDADGNALGVGFSNAAVASTVIVSVEQTSLQLWSITVYPNPTSDKIILDWSRELSGNIRMTLYDMQGKEVMNGNYSGAQKNQLLDTSLLVPGTYIMQLYHAHSSAFARAKFIKSHD